MVETNFNGMNPEKEGVLWIRFVGKNLERRSIPIYELGQILISLQQIINKAYLYKKNRIESSGLKDDEREKLALQLFDHKKGSDIYGISQFLSDSSESDLLKTLFVDGIKALNGFSERKLIDILKKKKPTEDELKALSMDQLFLALIFVQVLNIFKRIDAIGGIDSIEISTTYNKENYNVLLNYSTKDEARELQKAVFLGEKEEVIEGPVIRLHIIPSMVVVPTKRGNVKIYLSSDDFKRIRREAERDAEIKFIVKPRYRFGMEKIRTEEYEALSIEFQQD